MSVINPFAQTDSGQYFPTQLGVYDDATVVHDAKELSYWSQLNTLGITELDKRRKEAQRLLRENGVTYNVYGDTQKMARPWRLDPIPLLISHDDGLRLAAGLQQRAELLNLILKDIYGSQNLLKQGLLPPELIYGHQGFLPGCVGANPKHNKSLVIYSANLVRSSSGQLFVLDDRSQAPSGSGYALENRMVLTRVLPDIFQANKVHRLANFFKGLHKGLAGLSPQNKDNPRIVILTPGPFNETYFEHAYLAAYLGYTLVQGDDLTVRDGHVWLKTLAGLQHVDVILRRVDDVYCDPLELRSDSRLGVAGLMEAVRRGNVAIANPLGSSILENPGLLAFLPQLARYFLGEDLLLPSIATWWCGHAKERDFVLNNLDRLIIKHINRNPGNSAIFGNELSGEQQQRLRAEIIAKPYLFVGQEQMHLASVPAFIDHKIEPCQAVLRQFVVAHGNDYIVMSGGLTRVASGQNPFSVSNQSGGLSKDTWILAPATQETSVSNTPPTRTLVVEAVSEALTSRAADHLFWVGRYIERIEASARLLRTVLLKMRSLLEFNDPTEQSSLSVLLASLTHVTTSYPGFVGADNALLNTPQTELLSLAKDSLKPGSLAANIQAFVQTAFSVRDLWSQDTWRTIDNIQHRWQQRVINNDMALEHLLSCLDELITGIVAFTGFTSESMTREAGWLMLDSGRKLERALALITLLRGALVCKQESAVQSQVLEAVLYSTHSLTIYQRRYRCPVQLPMVLDLLLFDAAHPRSLAYQLQQLSAHIAELPRERKSRLSEEEQLVMKLYTDVKLSNLTTLLAASDEEACYLQLDKLLSDSRELIWQLADVIAQAYFSHSQTTDLTHVQRLDDEL